MYLAPADDVDLDAIIGPASDPRLRRPAEGIDMADSVERKVGDLTVRIDRARCIASSNCVKVAPGLFELDNESVVAFKKGADGGELSREVVLESCAVCPVDALSVVDDSGKKLI